MEENNKQSSFSDAEILKASSHKYSSKNSLFLFNKQSIK